MHSYSSFTKKVLLYLKSFLVPDEHIKKGIVLVNISLYTVLLSEMTELNQKKMQPLKEVDRSRENYLSANHSNIMGEGFD